MTEARAHDPAPLRAALNDALKATQDGEAHAEVFLGHRQGRDMALIVGAAPEFLRAIFPDLAVMAFARPLKNCPG